MTPREPVHGAHNGWCRVAGIPVKAKDCADCRAADAGRSLSWFVWDLNEPDPWGAKGPGWGPMPREQAERMVREGQEHEVPRHYRAAPWPSAAASRQTPPA